MVSSAIGKLIALTPTPRMFAREIAAQLFKRFSAGSFGMYASFPLPIVHGRSKLTSHHAPDGSQCRTRQDRKFKQGEDSRIQRFEQQCTARARNGGLSVSAAQGPRTLVCEKLG